VKIPPEISQLNLDSLKKVNATLNPNPKRTLMRVAKTTLKKTLLFINTLLLIINLLPYTFN